MGKITRYSTQIICEYILPLCKIEGTEGTEGTRRLTDAGFKVPSTCKRFPQVPSGGLHMSGDFSPELGLTQEELLEASSPRAWPGR